MTETSGLDSRRERARELERIRLALRRGIRQAASDPSTQLAWKILGVAADSVDQIRQSLATLINAAIHTAQEQSDVPLIALRVVQEAISEQPELSLPAAVRALLPYGTPRAAADMICVLQAAGLPVVPEAMLHAIRCISEDNLSADDAGTLLREWGPRWRLFADMRLIGFGIPPLDPEGFCSLSPIPVLDAYIDQVDEPPHPGWWADRSLDEQRYLIGRTVPSQLTEEDLRALGWWEEYHRRRFNQGLPYDAEGVGESELYRLLDAANRGDMSVLDKLSELLPDSSESVIEELRQAGFRRAYELTLQRSFDAAWEQVNAFDQPSSHTSTPFEKEVENLRAYLIVVRSSDERLDEAASYLVPISRSTVARENLSWVLHRKETMVNDRGPAENPYLVLGVSHGAPTAEWRRAWMEIRSEKGGNPDFLSKANEARDQIRVLERDGTEGKGEVFVIPLDKRFTDDPEISVIKQAASQPASFPSRTTGDALDAAIEMLRSSALKEFLQIMDNKELETANVGISN